MSRTIRISQIISLLVTLPIKLTKLNKKTNCVHFKTLGINNAYFKLQEQKTPTKKTLGTKCILA